MKTATPTTAVGLLGLVALLASAEPAQAALGRGAESVERDRSALAAKARSVSPTPAYTIHTIQSGAVQIREYVSASGLVFAVAWHGPVPPDLRLLLGDYYSDWQEANAQAPSSPGHGSRTVKGRGVTVARWGRMGHLHGRAWVEALVPAGVDIHEIR